MGRVTELVNSVHACLVCMRLRHRTLAAPRLLDAIGISSYPRQKEPWILRENDPLECHGIAALAYATKSEPQCARDRLLRCFSHAGSKRSVPKFDQIPSACEKFLFDKARIHRRSGTPALLEFFRHQLEACGQFNPHAKHRVQFSDRAHGTPLFRLQ